MGAKINRPNGLVAIRIFAEAANIDPSLVILAIDKQNPNFIAQFGGITQSIAQPKIRDAMVSLGKRSKNITPHYDEFLNAIVGEVGSVSIDDVGDALKDSVNDVIDITSSITKKLIFGAAILGVIYILFKTEAYKKIKV